LVIDRSVSMLFGKGIEFDYGENVEGQVNPNEEYLKLVWAANRKEILLHKFGLNGAEIGTWYCKVIPDGVEYQDKLYPRLVCLDPMLMTIETKPDDIETVTAYIITYMIKRNGKDEVFQERTTRQDTNWLIESGIFKNKKFIPETSETWDNPFPPIIHGQNLINIESVYGDPDVTDDVDELQDMLNKTSGNVSKIIDIHGHPHTIGEGVNSKEPIDVEPGRMTLVPPGAKVYNVEMQSDLASSMGYMLAMRQALFDITRTVDISSMNDKLGALTNFGLRVLYQDALAKNESKKQLYGDALLELNRRILLLANMTPEEGHIEWPEPLPVNTQEEIAGLTFDLQNGLVSNETVSEKRGYIWASENEKIQNEKSQGDNIGAMLLNNFNRGQ
ncbi:MAG: phage portal protein, partial [Clostridia bacterium]